jgi:hypothetical protein
MSLSAHLRRLRTWIAAVLAALLVTTTTSWTRATTILLTDERGAPASDAYVSYHYEGSVFNFVHPITYVARGSTIVRTKADGKVAIPFRVHFRPPLLFTLPPSAFVDCVVVPPLHSTFGPLGQYSSSRPGVFAIDDRWEHVTIFDASQDPELWVASLDKLYDCIRRTVTGAGWEEMAAAPDDTVTRAHARELIDHLRREYAAFLQAYGERARPRNSPSAWFSEQQRQEWQERMDADLAREPVWGPYVERMWRGNLDELARLEALLK